MSDVESDASSIEEPVDFKPPPSRGRRTSVSAESMDPTDTSLSTTPAPPKTVIPKSKEQTSRITAAVKNSFLFRQLDDDQYKDVVDAIGEKLFKKNDLVIQQGAIGDFFYIVDAGRLSCYVKMQHSSSGPGAGLDPAAVTTEWGKKVTEYTAGGSFGELALMYNSPRAATVQADTDCVLWALDRVTFRRILMDSTFRKRKMYEAFLEEVPLLSSLEGYERSKIADALESCVFESGEVVIRQGEQGDTFYIIESGDAVIKQIDDNGVEQTLPPIGKGDYFGELSLIFNKPRAATIIANGKLKCASLNKKAFDRLLGPALDIIKRNTANYAALTRRKSIQELIEKMDKNVVVK
eukprot:Partr_v1_DN24090_c0_g1_i1_m34665 putative protein kinase, cAMP-dependent, regulatory, type